ncbi:MAG: ATP-binding protein [Coriobacteriia bacterium]|nr:ATP-binding protein [Coriobacteriia bacterium]
MKNYFQDSNNLVDKKSNTLHEEDLDHIDNDIDYSIVKYPCRIAVYDDLLSTPRVIIIEAKETAAYLDEIEIQTYKIIEEQGGSFSFMVIRELVENFIHASFIEPTISIMEKGNKIRFTDQGPGIVDISLAQKVGITSATEPMKKYIRGVGSGLPIVKQYLEQTGGTLYIENNIKRGTVITITAFEAPGFGTVNGRHEVEDNEPKYPVLTSKEIQILELSADLSSVGPTDLNSYLDIPVSTAYRQLKSLEDKGYLLAQKDGDKKRTITQQGIIYLKEVHRKNLNGK